MWCCADKRDVLKLGTTHFTIKGDSDKINQSVHVLVVEMAPPPKKKEKQNN